MRPRQRSLRPLRHLQALLLTSGLCALLLQPGCAKKTAEKTDGGKSVADKSGSGKSPTGNGSPTTKPGTPEAEVYAALDGAIAAIKKRDLQTFAENYIPASELRNLRKEYGSTAAFAKKIAADPKGARELYAMLDSEMLPLFERARKVKPTFSSDNTVAKFHIVVSPAQVVKSKTSPFLAERNKAVKVSGYGGDLPAALKRAADDLQAGKIEIYLASMLPIVELQINDAAELAKRLKAAPAVTKQMIADLKLLAGKTARMEQNATVAVYEVAAESPPVKQSDVQPKPVKRVFKFQKADGNWRLFDNTTEMRKSTEGGSRKLAGKSDTLTMEKIGNQWRLSPKDPRFGGEKTREFKTEFKTIDKTPEFPKSKIEKTLDRR